MLTFDPEERYMHTFIQSFIQACIQACMRANMLTQAMLAFDPEERVSAEDALAMLPGLDKLGPMPTAGEYACMCV